MTPLIVSICLTGALLALTLSVISLCLHWIRRTETPEYAALVTRIQEQQTQHLDLLDKVEHWRKRDNVRRARLGAEEKLSEPAPNETPAEKKARLRTVATARGLGMTG